MLQSISTTLSKFGTVSPDDLNTINHLIDTGKTPTEVVAQMQTMDKFKDQ